VLFDPTFSLYRNGGSRQMGASSKAKGSCDISIQSKFMGCIVGIGFVFIATFGLIFGM
jgi:hypothetical protein